MVVYGTAEFCIGKKQRSMINSVRDDLQFSNCLTAHLMFRAGYNVPSKEAGFEPFVIPKKRASKDTVKLEGDVGKLISMFNEIVKENNPEVTMLIQHSINYDGMSVPVFCYLQARY